MGKKAYGIKHLSNDTESDGDNDEADFHKPSSEHPGSGHTELEQPESDLTQPREMPLLFGKGFIMGSADVVPGVSGGTMALILGIYERLIFAIKSVDANVIRWIFTLQIHRIFSRIHWKFLIVLLSGMISAILFFTKVVKLPVLMHTQPEIIYGLFFGLIAGSILILLKTIGNLGRWEVLTILIGTAIGYRIVTLVPTDTPETIWFVFLSGSAAITAMILPGISGSFILLILRKYEFILANVALIGTERTLEAILVLVPFVFGMLAGLALFVRVISWLLKKYHILTLCVLTGFMAGSLYVIWPFQEREYSEFVETRIMSVQDPEVEKMLQIEPDRRQPNYSEAGDIVNPAAPANEQLVEVHDIRRKLVKSSPYWPMWKSPDDDRRLEQGSFSLYGGLAAMIIGFIVVGFMAKKAGPKM